MVPVLNEEEAVPGFLEAIAKAISDPGISYEIVFVDDGSTDATADIIRAQTLKQTNIRMVRLSRNFGKEAALTAGMDVAQGDAVIPIDVDLQDPPELIMEFIRLWREGYDVVYGQRVERDADSRTKRRSAGIFYNLFNKLSAQKIEPNVGDFRLMSRPVVDATLQMRERNRFMKGLFAWVGFTSIAVPYTRPARFAGQTKFNYWKLWNFAIDGVTSFSTVPLRIWTYLGLIVALAAMVYTFVILIQTFAFGREVPGYASLMVVVLTLGAVQLTSLGIIGEYLGRLYLEVKQRPVYIVREMTGFQKPGQNVDTTSFPSSTKQGAADGSHSR
ncbi:glycosyltransferase family 2 protein [uncultured Sulfitobacter sp.]|uniref:glycosyltransferase family 2 protein n=1 Tax=uncultured Sulfitobacter sp. TaxID=191468 RepID=UPI00261CB1B4|nr:glycosyltransferase family 2 protein [uncultured Sulfitobacter sp.]